MPAAPQCAQATAPLATSYGATAPQATAPLATSYCTTGNRPLRHWQQATAPLRHRPLRHWQQATAPLCHRPLCHCATGHSATAPLPQCAQGHCSTHACRGTCLRPSPRLHAPPPAGLGRGRPCCGASFGATAGAGAGAGGGASARPPRAGGCHGLQCQAARARAGLGWWWWAAGWWLPWPAVLIRPRVCH